MPLNAVGAGLKPAQPLQQDAITIFIPFMWPSQGYSDSEERTDEESKTSAQTPGRRGNDAPNCRP